MVKIEMHENGIVIKSPIPANSLSAITKMAKALGFDQMDIGLCNALNATMVITSKEGSMAFRKEIEAMLAGNSKEDRWLHGFDTGTSSKTIFEVLSGRPVLGSWNASIPYDPDDFGRCFRLLEIFPEWKNRLPEVAKKYPAWTPLVEHWAELEALYIEELPKGRAPKLYERMKALIKEGQE